MKKLVAVAVGRSPCDEPILAHGADRCLAGTGTPNCGVFLDLRSRAAPAPVGVAHSTTCAIASGVFVEAKPHAGRLTAGCAAARATAAVVIAECTCPHNSQTRRPGLGAGEQQTKEDPR